MKRPRNDNGYAFMMALLRIALTKPKPATSELERDRRAEVAADEAMMRDDEARA